MGMLIDDLLTFSRLSRTPLNKQSVNTTRLVREALEELQAGQGKREIELHLGDLSPCHGDPALIKQVWVNLLSNAMKYTRKREKAVIKIGSTRENGEMFISFPTTGPALTCSTRDKLFGVFQRLHRADEFEGTGVGLGDCAAGVHRHGGRVWANAAPDRGASFYFTLGGRDFS